MLVVAHCILCRRQITYLAADLVTVFSPDAYIEELFGGACPRCGTSDFCSVRERHPRSDDAGHLRIRRPAGVRKIQLWRDEWYG